MSPFTAYWDKIAFHTNNHYYVQYFSFKSCTVYIITFSKHSSPPLSTLISLSLYQTTKMSPPNPKKTDGGSHPAHTIIGNADDAESSNPEFTCAQVFPRVLVHNTVPFLIVCRYISCVEDEDEMYKDMFHFIDELKITIKVASYFLHFMIISSSKLTLQEAFPLRLTT